MLRIAGAFSVAIITITAAQASDAVRCAADPQVRANFIGAQMIRALDQGSRALRSEGWMTRLIRDAEHHSDRPAEVCAANPELSLASALGQIAAPSMASAK